MPLRHIAHAPRALVVALALAACTDTELPTAATPPAPAQSLAPATPVLAAIAPTANPSLAVVPASVTITRGRGIPLRAVNLDPLNAKQANAPITWSSSNTGVATVSSTGHVRAVAPGTATITASALNRQLVATSAITVAARPNCERPTPLPTNVTGVIAPIPPTYEDTPLVFRFTIDDPDPCHRYTFHFLDVPILGVLYQVSDEGTTRLDAPLAAGMDVSNSEGWVAYYPKPGIYGHDSFRYNVRDDAGGLYSFLPVIPIQMLPVNDPPIVFEGTHVGYNNYNVTNVQLSTRDIDDVYTATDKCIVELPRNGDLYWNTVSPANRVVKGDCQKSGALRYASRIDGAYSCGPMPDRSTYPHKDSFRWYVSDGRAVSDTVTGSIRVDYANQPPTYRGPASVSTSEDTPASFTLTGSDPDGDVILYQVNTLPRHGTLWVPRPGSAPHQITILPAFLLADANGATSLQYVPDPNFNTLTQSDDFHFQVAGGDGPRNCDYAVRFDVAPVNDAPTIIAPDRVGAIVGLGGIGVPTAFLVSVADDARPTDVLVLTLRAQGPAAARVDLINPTGFKVRRISATEVVFEGTLPAINTLLGRGVTWTPNASGATYGELAIIVDDRGNFGSGGLRVGTKIVAVDVGFETEGGLELRIATPARETTRLRPTPDRR